MSSNENKVERQRGVQVASVPDLVVAVFVVVAVPDLDGVAVGHRSISQVNALAAVPLHAERTSQRMRYKDEAIGTHWLSPYLV